MARNEAYIECNILETGSPIIMIQAPRGAAEPELIYARAKDLTIEKQVLEDGKPLKGLVRGKIGDQEDDLSYVEIKDMGGRTVIPTPTATLRRKI